MGLNFTDSTTYSVSTSVSVSHSYHFVNDIFNPDSPNLAELYIPWKRCLAIVDHNVYNIYGERLVAYFQAHGIAATVQPMIITEDRKDVENLLKICGWITDFNILRREPVLVIGGGLVTDVVGFACAIYRRTTRYIRIPTTLIGLIDASVSNRVAINWNGLKNRLGGYHEPLHTIVHPAFLGTLPEVEIRNGIAEILKISSCTDIATFEALEQFGQSLLGTRFGYAAGGTGVLAGVADTIIRQAIQSILKVEVPNSLEQSLDRVMYFGHTWSPNLELAVTPPLLHGHAISVDMCFSATLAKQLQLLSDDQYLRFLRVFSTLGLTLDHPSFTLELMEEATDATIATRDGQLRAPVPIEKLGSHKILSMIDKEVLAKTWHEHKNAMRAWPRQGLGLDMDIGNRSLQLAN